MHSTVCGKEAGCICCYNKYPVIAIVLGLVSDLYNQDINCTHTGYIIIIFPVLYIQYRRGLWPSAINDMNLRTEGYVFSDLEFANFCSYFYYSLQRRLSAEKGGRNHFDTKRYLCIASNNIGDPDSKRSPGQASFRRDLWLIAEAAGIGKCSLVLTQDHRFMDAIIEPDVVRRKFKQCVKTRLGVDFNVHVRSLKSVIPLDY